MGKYINIGDTIEGEQVQCVVRKWVWQGLKRHPKCPKPCTLYTTDRNSEAVVVKSPQKQYVEGSHTDVGDTVVGDSLSVYVANSRKIKPDVIERNKDKEVSASGRHGANVVKSKDHTIASVKVPFKNLERMLGMSNNPKIEKK